MYHFICTFKVIRVISLLIIHIIAHESIPESPAARKVSITHSYYSMLRAEE